MTAAAAASELRRARAAIAADVVAGHDSPTLLRRVLRTIERVVPFAAGGVTTTDPDTLLPTGAVLRGLSAGAMAGCAAEGAIDRPDELVHELRVRFTSGGRCFGTGCLLREASDGDFTTREVAFLADVAADVADGLRYALRTGVVGGAEARTSGVLVVDDDRRVLSATDAAAAWLEELDTQPGDVPPVVHAVVLRACARAAGAAAPPARARVLSASGTWLSVHASVLSGDQRAWAVVVEPAHRSDVLPLLADAHDLTPREQQVLTLLLRGLPDRAVAEQLVVSPHTAREHAGRVLRKFGVRSRAELHARLAT